MASSKTPTLEECHHGPIRGTPACLRAVTDRQKKFPPSTEITKPERVAPIGADDRTVVGDELNNFLADTYALYLQTQNFDWNVAGPHFHPLQLMREEQYGQPAVAVDGIAERLEAWA